MVNSRRRRARSILRVNIPDSRGRTTGKPGSMSVLKSSVWASTRSAGARWTRAGRDRGGRSDRRNLPPRPRAAVAALVSHGLLRGGVKFEVIVVQHDDRHVRG